MATINLENAEVLGFSQSANYLDGGMYQYGRTVSLSVTAFIYPGNDIESTRFRKIDTTERTGLASCAKRLKSNKMTISIEVEPRNLIPHSMMKAIH